MRYVLPSFPTTTQLEARLWRNDTVVEWCARGEVGTVPVGFETDFASTPRALWWLFPPQGNYSTAALVHDYLYRTQPFKRKEADRIFLDLMIYLQVSVLVRRPMYSAVRVFGALAWKNARA